MLLVITAVLLSSVSPVGAMTMQSFSDVSTSDPHAAAIEYLQMNGIVQGYADGSFKPNSSINRAEFTKIVVGAVTSAPAGSDCFPDVAKEWFSAPVCYAKAQMFIGGYPDGTFHPERNINLAEALKIVLKSLNVSLDGTEGANWYDIYVSTATKHNYLTQVNTTIDHLVTRGEMAQLIYNIKHTSGSNTNANVSVNANTSTPQTPAVKIMNFAFSPNPLTIKAGTTVTWTNMDSSAHTVTGTGFDSGTLNKGQTFSHTFSSAGSFDYHCDFHPSMTAQVIVTP